MDWGKVKKQMIKDIAELGEVGFKCIQHNVNITIDTHRLNPRHHIDYIRRTDNRKIFAKNVDRHELGTLACELNKNA